MEKKKQRQNLKTGRDMTISFKCAGHTDIFTKHVMSCSHNMYDVTFTSGGGEDGGAVTL